MSNTAIDYTDTLITDALINAAKTEQKSINLLASYESLLEQTKRNESSKHKQQKG